MHESERHRVIVASAQCQTVATVTGLVEITGASAATIRRDIASLHRQGQVRRVRGGVEPLSPPASQVLAGRPYRINQTLNTAEKHAIARAAVRLCNDGELIIVNGGTTTFQMVHYLAHRHLLVFTNSLPIANYLIENSPITVLVPSGTIYREQNIILSPFDKDGSEHFFARRMFMGCQGLGPQGLMESDPLLVQAELKLIDQADELIVLADSAKFSGRSSLLLCGLDRIHTVVTDSAIRDADRQMLERADVTVVVANTTAIPQSSSAA